MISAFPGQTRKELFRDEKLAEMIGADEVTWQSLIIFPGTEYYKQGLREKWFTEESYRKTLRESYFFHHLPDAFNFSHIPSSGLIAFRKQHLPNF